MVLALELFFILIKSNKNINGINIFNHDFLYIAYADDTTLFLKDLDSVKNVLEMLNQLYMVSRLRRPNFCKCEVAGTGLLKNAKMALFGPKSLDLIKDLIQEISFYGTIHKSKLVMMLFVTKTLPIKKLTILAISLMKMGS